MRIEAGKHPAATYATDVYLDGQVLRRGSVKWVDEDLGQLERYLFDVNGRPLIVDDLWQTEIVRGEVRIELAPEHEHLRYWQI